MCFASSSLNPHKTLHLKSFYQQWNYWSERALSCYSSLVIESDANDQKSTLLSSIFVDYSAKYFFFIWSSNFLPFQTWLQVFNSLLSLLVSSFAAKDRHEGEKRGWGKWAFQKKMIILPFKKLSYLQRYFSTLDVCNLTKTNTSFLKHNKNLGADRSNLL